VELAELFDVDADQPNKLRMMGYILTSSATSTTKEDRTSQSTHFIINNATKVSTRERPGHQTVADRIFRNPSINPRRLTPNHESSVTAHQPLAEPNPCRGFITASRLSLEPSQSMSRYPGVEPTLCVLECRYHLFSIQFCSNSRSPPHISLFDVDPSLRDNLSPVQ
jgi:hypothetical protein